MSLIKANIARCLYNIICCQVIILIPAAALAEALQWSGSLKSLNVYVEEAPAGLAPEYWISSNRARLDVTWQPASAWRLETALDDQYLWSDPPGFQGTESIDYNRRLDLEKDWQHDKHGAGRLQVDRLNLQWRTGSVDTTIGRQAIGFGRILVFSPLDVIAPFAPDAIDTDVRSGVDALHAIYNYGLDGQIGAIAVWGEETDYNSFLGTWSDNWSGMDVLLIGGELRGRNMIGTGLAGSIGTLGLKGEISVYDGKDTDEINGDLHDHFSVAAVEAWYRFANGISLVTQYLYNGPGVGDPEDYPQALASAPLQEGLTYLLGRHYLIVTPSYEIHPLATLQGLVIYNIDDESALMRPTLDLSLADNLSLQVFWTWHTGDRPDVVSSLLPAVPRSEFGLFGDGGGLFIKWFF
jgi:hypothetical protein